MNHFLNRDSRLYHILVVKSYLKVLLDSYGLCAVRSDRRNLSKVQITVGPRR